MCKYLYSKKPGSSGIKMLYEHNNRDTPDQLCYTVKQGKGWETNTFIYSKLQQRFHEGNTNKTENIYKQCYAFYSYPVMKGRSNLTPILNSAIIALVVVDFKTLIPDDKGQQCGSCWRYCYIFTQATAAAEPIMHIALSLQTSSVI